MSELQDQVQAALASQYRIERELGGGGMSRVFLAEEIALSRRVVLKVLPPELGAILSAERFQREVRLAASLQHPHIVTLLSAGRAGGALYYTMPFVEGESLRARLTREGELPLSDVLRILREVVDALAYAHAQGVVHRDIKPDNVLDSSHHAVITDFGIARALDEADEESRLTGSGISIGTPAYMAPEQAAAERQVDQRADIYAVGILAYELLSGEPPFRGPTAQSVIAAHMTRAPVPITDHRASVPPDLAAVIQRCLEKRPSDRYQSAGELLAALASVGDSTTPRSQPSTARSPAERPWPLSHVLGYFGVTGAALLGVAWALRTLAGLPDWFFPAAVILLAVGLPIVVLATLAHNRRAEGRTTPLPVASRRLTLRKAVLGGIGAFVALGVVTTAYVAMRAFGIGPAGSLVASGKLAARERLIIADFANSTRDPQLGPAITQAFRVDFAQSKLVSPVEADYVRRVLRRMQKPDSVPLTLEVARDIAQRGAFKAVVAGNLQPVGASILVSAQLVNAQTGEVLATARATAKDSTGILDAVDRVSKQLRERIGESLRAIRAESPLADVTTGSLDALKQYSQAVQAENIGDSPKEIALLAAAVSTDSTFGMAWRKLGTVLANEGEDRARAEQALLRAYALRDRLTVRERLLTENSYWMDSKGSPDSGAAALQSLLSEYPEDGWAHNNLGVAYEIIGNRTGAEAEYRRSAELEPENILAWGNIYTVQLGQAKFDSAAATLAAMRKRFPPGVIMDEREATVAAAARDFATAEVRIRAVLARYATNPRARIRELRYLGNVLLVRGKLAEGRRTLGEIGQVPGGATDPAVRLVDRARLASVAGNVLGDQRAASAELDAALKDTPLDSLPPAARPLIDLIIASVDAGEDSRARALQEQFDTNIGRAPTRVAKFLRLMTRGRVLAMEKSTLNEGLATMRRAAAAGGCVYCIEAPMADAFDRAGMADSALAHYEVWAGEGEDLWDGGPPNFWQAKAFFRLGELYEAKGDKTKAVDFYGRFTELWREADPQLQPRVREAKRRIQELLSEPKP